jgi:hypothetical protein
MGALYKKLFFSTKDDAGKGIGAAPKAILFIDESFIVEVLPGTARGGVAASVVDRESLPSRHSCSAQSGMPLIGWWLREPPGC